MLSLNFTASAMAHLTAAANAFDDVDPCGTPVPGHPPLPKHALADALSRFDKVALNPQPLPPQHGGFGGRIAISGDDIDPCGTVPRRFPPGPPPPSPLLDLVGQPAFNVGAFAQFAAGRHG